MLSMYETIRGLPLFKGTGTEQISAFLEKTNVEFVNFLPEQVIAEAGGECVDLRFIISGTVRSSRSLADGRASLQTQLGSGAVISPCNLFGFYTQYEESLVAITEGSYMQIRKSQYFDLLKSDSIYMLNLLNYLSYNAQRSRKALCAISSGSLSGWLCALRAGLLDRHSRSAMVASSRSALAEILSIAPAELEQAMAEMQGRGEIECEGDLNIKLL